MPQFTFEIIYDEGSAEAVESLPDNKAAWCYVEFLASQIVRPSARITVRNAAGEIVIQAGAATARASVGWCCKTGCPLKGPPAGS